MGGFVSKTQPARPRARRRLVAACTAGILSLGALALGTGAQAAEPGAHHGISRPALPGGQLPSLHLPAAGKAAPKSSATAQAATPAPPRYDVDGDGSDDQLYRAGDTLYNSLADRNEELGVSTEKFVDLLTPGDLDGAAGPEVLATTS